LLQHYTLFIDIQADKNSQSFEPVPKNHFFLARNPTSLDGIQRWKSKYFFFLSGVNWDLHRVDHELYFHVLLLCYGERCIRLCDGLLGQSEIEATVLDAIKSMIFYNNN